MNTDDYKIGHLLGETEHFRLYDYKISTGESGILKIAAAVEDNPLLDWEAYLLSTLRREAAGLEEAYAKIAKETSQLLNNHFFFPNLEKSFISEEQGGRRINLLSFAEVKDDLSRLVPLSHLASRDLIRIDPKTSAWIIGKLLKLLSFAHDQEVSVGNLEGDNILIERNEHYVMVFDWSSAVIHSAKIPDHIGREEISSVAKEVILALGGDPDTGELPADEQLADDSYKEFLFDLACGAVSDASSAHRSFYNLIRSLWPRGFHPFTGYSINK